MAYPYTRKRIPRGTQQPDLMDANGDGYPDAFEAEEAQLLAQISQRRKQFMQGAGKAEERFVEDPTMRSDEGDTEEVTGYLFK